MSRYPTADQVARAIVAACRETGSDPIAVASGEMVLGGPHGNLALSRARVYAAWALDELGFDCGAVAVARMCGVATCSEGSFLASVRHRFNHGKLSWFSRVVVDRVKMAIGRPAERKAAAITEGGPLTMKREPVPAALCEDLTAKLMGDPPHGRSALADYIAREASHQHAMQDELA